MNNAPASIIPKIIISDNNYLIKILSYLSGLFYIFMLTIMLIICYTMESLVFFLY